MSNLIGKKFLKSFLLIKIFQLSILVVSAGGWHVLNVTLLLTRRGKEETSPQITITISIFFFVKKSIVGHHLLVLFDLLLETEGGFDHHHTLYATWGTVLHETMTPSSSIYC